MYGTFCVILFGEQLCNLVWVWYQNVRTVLCIVGIDAKQNYFRHFSLLGGFSLDTGSVKNRQGEASGVIL